jgi:FkbM family methyltransferase
MSLKTKDYHPFNKSIFDLWVKDKGDLTHRLNYNLNPQSIVVDAGGYKGEWADKISKLYGCKMYIFEPVGRYYYQIEERFKSNGNIKVFRKGVSNSNEKIMIFDSEDSSSIYWGEGNPEEIELVNFSTFLSGEGIDYIDLLKVNIEGGEYDLLEGIINKGDQVRINNIQVQFHRFVEGCVDRRLKIREALSKTHILTYDYEFIWENWKLKE